MRYFNRFLCTAGLMLLSPLAAFGQPDFQLAPFNDIVVSGTISFKVEPEFRENANYLPWLPFEDTSVTVTAYYWNRSRNITIITTEDMTTVVDYKIDLEQASYWSSTGVKPFFAKPGKGIDRTCLVLSPYLFIQTADRLVQSAQTSKTLLKNHEPKIEIALAPKPVSEGGSVLFYPTFELGVTEGVITECKLTSHYVDGDKESELRMYEIIGSSTKNSWKLPTHIVSSVYDQLPTSWLKSMVVTIDNLQIQQMQPLLSPEAVLAHATDKLNH